MYYLMQVCAFLQYKSVGDYIFLIMIYSKKWENSFKHKVTIAKFIGKMQKKSDNMKSGFRRHASFSPRRSVR